jgi:beta-mannanase
VAITCALLPFAGASPQAQPRAKHHRPLPVALGVNTFNAPGRTSIRHYTRLAHARPAIVMWYQEFDTPLITRAQLRDVRAERATPMISWRPVVDGHQAVQFAAIARGDDDAYLKQQAIKARRAKQLIFVRFGYEMNLSGQDYGSAVSGETPASFVAAWRHIVTVFRDAAASNVRFVWSPNTDCAGHCPFTAYWPGDSYVDWLGLDGYNFAAAHDAAWVSLHYIFASSYSTITGLSTKPLMIAETASAPTPGDKAAWIRRGFRHAIPRAFPRVRAVVWFDQDKETDWRVNSSRQSLHAWRAVAASHRYSGNVGG